MKNRLMLKGQLPWLPYFVAIGVLYFLGRIDFQIHHPILFLATVLVASVALVATVPYLTGRQE